MNINADLIVFRQTLSIKHLPAVARQSLQDLACKTGAYAIGWHKRPTELARVHIDDLKFGKLIAVNTMRHLRERRGQRQHRHLHHVVAHAFAVDERKSIRVDHVLRVMQHNSAEPYILPAFEHPHAPIDRIEAISL